MVKTLRLYGDKISKRQNQLLEFIVREYVKTAKPIPSAVVQRKSRLHVSPATIRGEMNHLEERGFLSQLHTSGGRVPTDKAYRYFINHLLARENLLPNAQAQKQITQTIHAAGNDPRLINKSLATLLSKLSDNLVITGISEDGDFFKVGLGNLFEMPEFREFDHIFQLTSFFEDFDMMFQLIEREFLRILGAPAGLPIQILIGRENPFLQIKGETIMCAKYLLPGDVVGSLTLIGPKRMDYEKNIALILYTARELGKTEARNPKSERN